MRPWWPGHVRESWRAWSGARTHKGGQEGWRPDMQVRECEHRGRNTWVEAKKKGGQWGGTHGGGQDMPKGAGMHGQMGRVCT